MTIWEEIILFLSKGMLEISTDENISKIFPRYLILS